MADFKDSGNIDGNSLSVYSFAMDPLLKAIHKYDSNPAATSLLNGANFYSLPAELRNEIYEHLPFCYKGELILKTKIKRNRPVLQVQFREPTICQAVPLVQDEVLSLYYSHNRFKLFLQSAADREAFLVWVRRRSGVLKGIKTLRIFHTLNQDQRRTWYLHCRITSLKVRLRLDTEGRLKVEDQFDRQGLERCFCTLDKLVEERLTRHGPQHESSMVGVDSSRNAEEFGPIIAFALKFCRALMLSHADEQARREMNAGSTTKCRETPLCWICENLARIFEY